MNVGTHWALACDDPPKAKITFVHIHARVRILIRNAWKAHTSASVLIVSAGGWGGGGSEGARWAREVCFICICHTSLLCYSGSTIILITVCLSLSLHPLLFLLLQFLRSGKMRWLVYRQICTSPNEGWKSLCVVTGFTCRINWSLFIELLGLLRVGFMGNSLEITKRNRKILNLMTISLRTIQTLNEITKDDLRAVA